MGSASKDTRRGDGGTKPATEVRRFSWFRQLQCASWLNNLVFGEAVGTTGLAGGAVKVAEELTACQLHSR